MINWTYYPQKGDGMTQEKIKEQLQNIDQQLNERANQLLAADPLARELLGLKKGLEMCSGEGEIGQNGSVENERSLEAINQS